MRVYKPCEHCGSPIKWSPDGQEYGVCEWIEKQTHAMRQDGCDERKIDIYQAAGFDPPCCLDLYEDQQRELAADWNRSCVVVTATFIFILVLLLLGIFYK